MLKILFFVYLTSAYLNATHMHSQESEHEHECECEVCLLVKHFPSSDLPNSDLQLPDLESYIPEDEPDQKYIVTSITKGFNATAPPVCRSIFIF